MHTVISLIELGEADHALNFAVGELATAQTLADGVVDGVGNPAVAALLLAKSAQAAERGIEFAVTPRSALPPDVAPDHELVTILGNLLDNAFDAVAAVLDGPRRVEVGSIVDSGTGSSGVRIVVTDTGPGLTPDQAASAFTAGWSTKHARGPAGGRGLGLALVAQAVARCRGSVRVEPGPGARFEVWLPLPATDSPGEEDRLVRAADEPVGGRPS